MFNAAPFQLGQHFPTFTHIFLAARQRQGEVILFVQRAAELKQQHFGHVGRAALVALGGYKAPGYPGWGWHALCHQWGFLCRLCSRIQRCCKMKGRGSCVCHTLYCSCGALLINRTKLKQHLWKGKPNHDSEVQNCLPRVQTLWGSGLLETACECTSRAKASA